MRAVHSGAAPLDAEFAGYMELCVQCRGCEAACPSSVPFGHLMEGARAALQDDRRRTRSWPRRVAEWLGYRLVLPPHWVLLTPAWVLAVAPPLHARPQPLPLPPLP